MMLGWLSAAAAWASAWNRRRNARSSASVGVQDLDGHAAPQLDVVGQVHGGGRARADGRHQPVAPAEHASDLLVAVH